MVRGMYPKTRAIYGVLSCRTTSGRLGPRPWAFWRDAKRRTQPFSRVCLNPRFGMYGLSVTNLRLEGDTFKDISSRLQFYIRRLRRGENQKLLEDNFPLLKNEKSIRKSMSAIPQGLEGATPGPQFGVQPTTWAGEEIAACGANREFSSHVTYLQH
jgi:hypothetical protein